MNNYNNSDTNISLSTQIQYNNNGLLPQWIQSRNGSEFCQYNDLPEDTESKLRQEDKFTLAISGLRYTVKDYNGKWLVFRRNIETSKARSSSPIHHSETASIVEIKVMPLSEANDCLQSERPEYQIFGSEPVKIMNNEAYVLMVKRSGGTQK
jgi:hypothetical protein